MYRVANLPDALSTHMSNVHMGMVGANEFYEMDASSGILRRKIRAPKSLRPQLTVLVDDLYSAYTTGVKTIDYSYPVGEEGRVFQCHVVLLFWTGDYPAQALVSGTHSKTCHWCIHKSTSAPEVSRRCWGDYRCFLPDNHPYRMDATFGKQEKRPPPTPRKHEDFVELGKANESYRGPKVRAPYKSSGIKEQSPLCALPMFDITWDILGDMMHILSGIWSRHVFEMLAGLRTPAKPKPRTSWTAAANNALAKAHDTVLIKLRDWAVSPDMKAVNQTFIYIALY